MTDLSKTAQKEKMESLLEEFGLNHISVKIEVIYSPVENAEEQKLPVPLATDPKFVLLDEPFAGVDPVAVEDIQRIVAHLKKKNIGI